MFRLREYTIMTDSCASLTPSEIEEFGLKVVSLSFLLNDVNYVDTPDHANLSPEAFYERIQAGDRCKTSAANADDYAEAMEAILKEGKDVLYIGFSSALSSTVQSARIAAEDLRQRYPEASIVIVDSLCACRGEGMLVYRVAKAAKEQAMTLEQAASFAEAEKQHQAHWFFVDDLERLKQGGRVSGVAAAIGGLLNIKPVMHCDSNGKLTPVSKVRGVKAAMKALTDRMEADAIKPVNQDPVFICHANCPDYVEELEKLLTARFGELDFRVGYTCPVIGAHTGIRTIGLFFTSDKR